MTKFYYSMTIFYRICIIVMVIASDVLKGFDYQAEKIFMYVFLGMYVVAFSVLKATKWNAYLELALVLVILLKLQDVTFLHFLLVVPFTNFVSSNAKKYDIIAFWLILVLYMLDKFSNPITVSALAIALFFTIYIFHEKFHIIENMSDELFVNKNEVKELQHELRKQQLGSEIMIKMFYHMRELSETETEKEVMKKMVQGSTAFFNAQYTCVYRKDEDEDYYERAIEFGDKKKYDIPERLQLDEISKEPTFQKDVMKAPVIISGEEWGVMHIYGKQMAIGHNKQLVVSPFNDSDFETMLTYIYSVAKRVTELQISQQNSFLANNDFLTKVPNRRYFWEQLDRMVDLAQRGDDFAVLIMDIDNFKSFNDTYGHIMGDSVLKIVAETLELGVRKADIVGRVGGEEFAVILYKPKGEGMLVAERIRKMVAAVPAVRQITLSIGLAYFGKHGDTVEELMINADAAMYVAKTTGKNRVVEYQYGMNMEQS